VFVFQWHTKQSKENEETNHRGLMMTFEATGGLEVSPFEPGKWPLVPLVGECSHTHTHTHRWKCTIS
jgi:hypothetical protein